MNKLKELIRLKRLRALEQSYDYDEFFGPARLEFIYLTGIDDTPLTVIEFAKALRDIKHIIMSFDAIGWN